MMENSNQSIPHPAQITSQRYNHQLQPAMWNNKVCQSASGQNTSLDPYSQQMNHYYQAQYSPQASDINRYVSPVPKDQNSNSTYSQYPMARQTSYSCTVPGQNYQMPMKSNCNNMYYANANTTKNYAPNNVVHSSKKYMNSSLGLSQTLPAVPQGSQITRNTGTPMPQMPQYGDHASYPMQNAYVSNYNVNANPDNEQSYMLHQAMAPTTLSSQETLMHSVPMVSPNQVSQMSSIPTPPETSSLPGDGLTVVDNTSHDNSAENIKLNVSNSSFVLPGNVIGHMSSSVSSVTNTAVMSNRNAGHSLQPPANLDEGSQASSASASSSIPDEQSSVKANSKPNFSYPPTPNTLSSPGAASMSSFHDDLECISSPGWPKTPASPVTNGNYEFANIKRPENLLKLYTLSDEPDRRYFLDKLIVFSEERGSPLSQCPTISKQPLDVYRVYITVKERGGFVEVTNAKRWKDIAGAIGVGASSSAAYTLRKQYMKILLPFECKFDRGGMDPQPIINMVEASSRKKGKNAPPGSYGSQSHYSHGYPQQMERYPPGYPGPYQSSRYQCNNNAMDYQCTSNSMHYPQSTGNAPHSTSGQNQYNQYSHGSPSNYRYYQGSNSTPNAGYNSNMPTTNDNLCRFGRNTTSTPVPQEQGYFSHQYPTAQTEQNIQDIFGSERGCSVQENITVPLANQINDIEQLTPYSTVNNSVDISPLKSDTILSKSNADSFGNMNMEVSLAGPTVDSSQENKMCFDTNFSVPNKIATLDQNSIAKTFTGQAVAQQYQSLSDSTLNKTPEANYYSDTSGPSYTNRNQAAYLNQVQTNTHQKMAYQGEYQNKEPMQTNQYARFPENQSESYRGSEGPPGLPIDRIRNVAANDGVTAKAYAQYNCNVPSKPNSYAYAPQQGQNKETFSHSAYSNQFNIRPQRAWHSEHAHHPYQQVGQRPHMKNHVSLHDGKQPENSRPRRSWVSFQNASQSQIKNKSISGSNSSQNQSFQIKAQPHTSPSTSQMLQSIVKKPFEFPPNTIEAIRPVAVKRRRCPAKRLGSVDPWRLMLALKSGLLAECTWALDTISILLADNSSVVYFNLNHLPGFLNVLVDHYRCFLNKIFNLAEDMELGKSINLNQDASGDHTNSDSSDIFSMEGKTNILNTTNFTYRTRCHKKVEIQYDEALFLIDPQHSWDTYEGFNMSAEHWQKGGSDTTSHIQTCFAENTDRVKFSRELKCQKTKDTDMKNVSNKPNFFKSSLLYKGEPIVVLKKFNFSENKVNKVLDSESEMDTEDSCSIIYSSIENKRDCSDKKICPEKDSSNSSDDIQILNDSCAKYQEKSCLKPADDSNKTFSNDHINFDQLTITTSETYDGLNVDSSLNISKSCADVNPCIDLTETSSENDNSNCSVVDLTKVSSNENSNEGSKNDNSNCSVVDLTKVSSNENSNECFKNSISSLDNSNSVTSEEKVSNAISGVDKLFDFNEDVIEISSEEVTSKESNEDLFKNSSENDNSVEFVEFDSKSNSEKENLGVSIKDVIVVNSELGKSINAVENLTACSEKHEPVNCKEDPKATILEKQEPVNSNKDHNEACLENKILRDSKQDLEKASLNKGKLHDCNQHLKSSSVNDISVDSIKFPNETSSDSKIFVEFNENSPKTSHLNGNSDESNEKPSETSTGKNMPVDSNESPKKTNHEKDNVLEYNESLKKTYPEKENSLEYNESLKKPNPEKDISLEYIESLKKTNPEKDYSLKYNESQYKATSEKDNCINFIEDPNKTNTEKNNPVNFSREQKKASSLIDCSVYSNEDPVKINPEIENLIVANKGSNKDECEKDLLNTNSIKDVSINSSENVTKADSFKTDSSVDSNKGFYKTISVDLSGFKTSSESRNFVESNYIKASIKDGANLPSTVTENCDIDESSIMEFKNDICDEIKELVKTNEKSTENIPRLRGSLSSRKRFLCADLEDEAYSYDQPALCVTSDSQELLSRRCVCVSTIIRNLSFVPGNDVIMSKNPGVLVLLGRLLLLHHEHRPVKNAYHKYEKEGYGDTSWEESCTSLKDEPEWWLSTLNVLRDNTFVILSNISGHLDLSPFPEEVSLPILDGLLHWVVCTSSYAQDPLPSRSPSSVLSPQRLCLETLCKLSVLSNNVDLIIATPPWSRIETLFEFLTKSLCSGQDQIMREFALILLSNISQADSVAARTIAEQTCCLSYLISFVEEAEANAFQIASSQGTKKLRDKPELMGTTPGMVQRAANTLKNLALVPENRVMFMRHQPQLLSLVMSQIMMDQELAAIIADILFYCSDNVMGGTSSQLPNS